MTKQYVLYIATTLDGYIATHDHSLDWLTSVEGDGDNGYSEFYKQIDTVVMGRTTYDWVMRHTDAYPYHNVTSYVLTTRELKDNTIHTSHDLDDLIQTIETSDAQHIWVIGGGKLITDFITKGLIDTMKITIAPVLLGSGIPLFTHMDHTTNLKLLTTTRYKQFVELNYQVLNKQFKED